MVAIENRTSLVRWVLAEIRHFLFCCNSSHFVAFHPQSKNLLLKFTNQGEGRKMQGKSGPRTTHGDGSETKAGKCDKCLNTQEASGTKGRFSCTPSYPRQWRRRCPSPPWQRGRGPRPAPRPTSRHQSAREETGENKKSLKIVMYVRFSRISSRQATGFEKEKNKH